jgi:hypothetical protein
MRLATKVRYLNVRLLPKEFQLLVYILHFWGVEMTDWMNLCYVEIMAVTTLRQMPHYPCGIFKLFCLMSDVFEVSYVFHRNDIGKLQTVT